MQLIVLAIYTYTIMINRYIMWIYICVIKSSIHQELAIVIGIRHVGDNCTV